MLGEDPVAVVGMQEGREGFRVVRHGLGRDTEDDRAGDAQLGDEDRAPLGRAIGKNEELLEDRPCLDGVARRRRSRGGRLGLGPGRPWTRHAPPSRL